MVLKYQKAFMMKLKEGPQKMVGPGRFELPTSALSERRDNQSMPRAHGWRIDKVTHDKKIMHYSSASGTTSLIFRSDSIVSADVSSNITGPLNLSLTTSKRKSLIGISPVPSAMWSS